MKLVEVGGAVGSDFLFNVYYLLFYRTIHEIKGWVKKCFITLAMLSFFSSNASFIKFIFYFYIHAYK